LTSLISHILTINWTFEQQSKIFKDRALNNHDSENQYSEFIYTPKNVTYYTEKADDSIVTDGEQKQKSHVYLKKL